jgi:gamma-glutamyltranspeptidase/glutathione hydrolase
MTISSEHLVQNWQVRKPLARARGGIVATQTRVAGFAGTEILAAGGNAVDAAVATGLALAAVEPWNSGIGGIGFMLVYLAREKKVHVVDFGPISPHRLNPADYPLTGGTTTDLFTWPTVKDDRNVHGPMSIAVPGHVDGLATALARFGTKPFAELAQPAIKLADQGIALDWYLTLKIATTAKELGRYPSTRAVWLTKDGLPPVTQPGAPLERLKLTGLADTLRTLAKNGPRDFYEGEIARALVKDFAAGGSVIDAEDLKNYHARVVAPLELDYHGVKLNLPGGLTAAPTFAKVLGALKGKRFGPGKPGADTFVAYAEALREAYAERLATMGDQETTREPTSTTHFNVVDKDGNMVAVTQTLLSVFGSRYVLPSTGILMNNGINWFDPRPESANCLAPSKRPLTNMCPMIAQKDGNAWFAIGASGGRKIMPAVFQLASFMIDHGLSLEEAFHQPRIDASGGDAVGADPRLPADVLAALRAQFPVNLTELVVYPTNFACPSCVMRDPATGENSGITDVLSPWSGAVAEI